VNFVFEKHYMLVAEYINSVRGTYLSVTSVKGYMVRERLGTLALEY